MDNTLTIFLDGAFFHNIVLAQFLGICSFLGVSKNLRNSLGMAASVSFVMLLSALLSHALYHFLLVPLHLEYLKTIVFILAIAALVQLVEMYVRRYLPALHKSMGIFLPLITTNCTILGIALINVQHHYTFVQSMVNALGTATGYTLAIVIFACLRKRLEESDLPQCMRGLPIALLTAGCMSIALMGLAGIH